MQTQLFTLLAATAVSGSASAALVINDLDGTVENTGNGPQNGGLLVNSSVGPAVRADFDFTQAAATVVGSFDGSAAAVNLVPGATATYDGLLDLNYQALLNAGLDTSNAVLSFDYEGSATLSDGGYNGIVIIANTDGTDGNSYNQGANGVYFGSGPISGTASIAFDDLVSILDPAVNPNYSALRLLANKDAGSTLDITIDNIAISVVPEPASLALVGLGGLATLRRRSR